MYGWSKPVLRFVALITQLDINVDMSTVSLFMCFISPCRQPCLYTQYIGMQAWEVCYNVFRLLGVS
jgi:hypothetical protein